MIFKVVLAALNLVGDPMVSSNPLAAEFRHWHESGKATLSRFEENFTWNTCLKLTVDGFATGSDGLRISTGILVGGDGKSAGLPVRGGEKLRFSFDVKGTAPNAVCVFKVWDKNGKSRHILTPLNRFTVGDKWVPRKGEVEVPSDAVRGAIGIQFWHDEKYGKMPFKVGDYLLVDNISVSRKTLGREIWPKRAFVLPSDGSAVRLARFLSANRNVEDPAMTEVSVRQDGSTVFFDFTMERIDAEKSYSGLGGNEFWKDDHVEVMFEAEGRRAHFGVSAGGGVWMRGAPENSPLYAGWKADVTRQDGGWRAKVAIPWKVAGFKECPKPGVPVAAQFCRTRDRGPVTAKVAGVTRTGLGRWFNDSSWSFVDNGFSDIAQWGVMFVGSMKPYVEGVVASFKTDDAREKAKSLDFSDATAAWRELEALKEKDRMDFLSSQPLILAQVKPSVNPEIPFMPDELSDPQPVFRVKAAVNEYAVLPVALANMTDGHEDYRVTLTCGWDRREVPRHEHTFPSYGLKSSDGGRIGTGGYMIRRAVRFRDSDAKDHGRRYDTLTSLGSGGVLTVASKDAALLWLSFDCRGLKPGVYRGVITATPLSGGCRRKLRNRGGKGYEIEDDSKIVPVELTVLPFALPETEFGFNGYARVTERHTFDWLYSVGACPTHLLLTPWHFECDFNADGTVAKRRLREYAEPEVRFYAENVKKIPGLPRVMVCYSVYEHYRNRITKGAPFARGSEEFWRGYREWIKYIDEVVVSNGISRDDYTVEVFDEPNKARLPDAAEVVRAVRETKKAVPGISVMITSGVRAYFGDLKNDVDDWVHYSGYPDLYAQAKKWSKTGRRVSIYQCGTGIREDNHRTYRVLPWRSYSIGGRYVSLYQLLSQAPGADLRQATSGEIVLVGESETLSTVRAENFILGLNDIRYVKLIEHLAAGDSPAAKEARAFLAKSAKNIITVYPHDAGKAEEFREEASRLIMKLKNGACRGK